MQRFPIGFWNYVPVEKLEVSCVQDWADAGMTLPMSPEYAGEPEEVERMREILDAADAQGMRVILCDKRTRWRQLAEQGEETFRGSCKEAIEQLGGHPATFGFHVGDEPQTGNFEDACRALRIVNELAPHLRGFLNLLPWGPEMHRRVGYLSWAGYLDAYVDKARPGVLCYDCYAQMNPGTEGWDMYFTNLREFQAASERHGIPWWTTLLSAGHFHYRCPNEDDFRWQLHTSLAHGARGILWFFLYMREPHVNYRIPPIDEHYERTETFGRLSRVNRTFLQTWADLFKQLTLVRAQHLGQSWGGVPAFDGSGRVARAESDKTPLIVSQFRHADGSDYVAVVNNSTDRNTFARLWLRGSEPSVSHVRWEGRHEPVPRDGGADYVRFTHWLAPGQMEVIRVEDASADKGG